MQSVGMMLSVLWEYEISSTGVVLGDLQKLAVVMTNILSFPHPAIKDASSFGCVFGSWRKVPEDQEGWTLHLCIQRSTTLPIFQYG